MRIGVYCEGLNQLSSLISKDLRENNHEVISLGCICKYHKGGSIEEFERDGMITPIFLLHPHNSNQNKCYERIADFISKVPDSQFYILALGEHDRNEPRVEGIGQHPNATYITETNSCKIIPKLMTL